MLHLFSGVLLVGMLLWLVRGALKLKLKFYALMSSQKIDAVVSQNRRHSSVRRPSTNPFLRAAELHQCEKSEPPAAGSESECLSAERWVRERPVRGALAFKSS